MSLWKGKNQDVINKFGVNLDIDTGSTPETIWSHGGQFPFLDTGISADIVSTSVNDTLLGSGARQVKITYYTEDSTEVVEIKDLDGTTRVQLSDDFKICTRIELESTGTSNTNEGEINVVDRATGLVVYQSVEIGEGQTLSAVQICPKGKRGKVTKHFVTYAKTQAPAGSADMRFNLRKVDGTVVAKHVVQISATKEFDNYEYPKGGITVEAGEIVYWQCLTVSANDTPIEGRFDIEFKGI
jgi:hypothetical protein